MKRFSSIFLAAVMMFASVSEAKSSSCSSSFRSSSFSSKSSSSSFFSKPASSSFSSKPATSSFSSKPVVSTPAPTPAPTPKQTAVVSKPVSTTFSKPTSSTFSNTAKVATGAAVVTGVAVASTTQPTQNSVDKAATKSIATGSNVKSFTSKSQAETAYRQSLVNQNKYTSATPPSVRPAYIPKSTMIGGRSVNVTYHALPGGGYGYGYIDPTTNMFMTLAAANMIADAAMMNSAGYAIQQHPVVMNQPTVIQQPAQHHGFSVFLSIMIVLLFVAIVIFTIAKI